MYSNNWALKYHLITRGGCMIKDFSEPITLNRDLSIFIFTNAKLPIRKNLYRALRSCNNNDMNYPPQSSCRLINSKRKCFNKFSGSIYKNNILGKIKLLLSKQGNKGLRKIVCNFNKEEESLSVFKENNIIGPYERIICGKHRRKKKRKGSDRLVLELLKACSVIRKLSLETKPIPQQRSHIDTLYRLEDSTESLLDLITTIDQTSLTSKSFYVRTSANIKNNGNLPKLNSPTPRNSENPLGNYEVKPAYISVFKKYFPKLHILCSETETVVNTQYTFPCLGTKPHMPINQTNNNNSTNNNINTHKYFRHAQQLLSNNSSQMQSIVYGGNENSEVALKRLVIKPFQGGNVAETYEDVRFLQNKLNGNIIDEENSIPTNNGREERNTDKIEVEIQKRINHKERPKLSDCYDRSQYLKMNSQTTENEKCEDNTHQKTHQNVMHSPKNVKKRKERTQIISIGSSSKSPQSIDESPNHSNTSMDKCSDNMNNIMSTTNDTIKKVSFNIDFKRKEFLSIEESDTLNNKIKYLEQHIDGAVMMMNNVVRRMNNLEIHFQEFSELFIKLHKETLNAQKKMFVDSRHCDCVQLNREDGYGCNIKSNL